MVCSQQTWAQGSVDEGNNYVPGPCSLVTSRAVSAALSNELSSGLRGEAFLMTASELLQGKPWLTRKLPYLLTAAVGCQT
jgi:hypothetical protein